MRRALTLISVSVVLFAIAAGGFWAGQNRNRVESFAGGLGLTGAFATPRSGPVIYYRHPDGEPSYSATPRMTADGRPFVAVHASEDASFDPPAGIATAPGAEEGPASQQASGKRRVLYYRNPMGLPDTSPVPKKDNMGMDYIPVYEGEEEEEAGSTVKVAPGKLQRTGVRTAEATRSAIIRQVRVPGTIMLDERRISVVSTRTDAFVEEVADVTTGAKIAEGEPLVRFYAKEIAAAGALYVAELRSGVGKGKGGGALQRLQNLGVPDAVIKEIQKTRTAPISITLTAPRNGVVLGRMAVEGMMAEAGDPLFRIADLSTVWVTADVPEFELGAIKPGARATVRVRSLPGREFEGAVALIYPEVEMQTRTAKVRIELPNPEGVLMANMYAEVEIASGSPEPVVTVPDSAVIDSGDRQVVIVDKGEGRFEPRDVKLGARGEAGIEIIDGIAEGERVVVSANFLIDAESNLKAALGALQAAEAQP
jgi:Cu(I)/Ag(I) efflux system membrane fusion protein